MRRHTQIVLYHLLPAVFWLLAIGGSLVPLLPILNLHFSIFNYIPAALTVWAIHIIGGIKRYTNSVEECFLMALLLGIASYWLPTIVFLTIPAWIYLTFQNVFSFRAWMATLIGYAVVAIWAIIAVYLGWIDNPWEAFFASKNAWGWIPTGAVLIAWIASTIARQNLRVR